MSEPRKVEEGDKLIYINNGWGGQFAQSEQIVKKVTKAGFTTNRGEIVRGTTYETDQASGRMFVYFGTAPNQTRAYLETPKSIAYIQARINSLNTRLAVKRLINNDTKYNKVINGDIAKIYEILKAYE